MDRHIEAGEKLGPKEEKLVAFSWQQAIKRVERQRGREKHKQERKEGERREEARRKTQD